MTVNYERRLEMRIRSIQAIVTGVASLRERQAHSGSYRVRMCAGAHFFDVVRRDLGWDAEAADAPLPEDALAVFV
jgi:hypothetical protein